MQIQFYLNREQQPRRLVPEKDATVLHYLRDGNSGAGLRGSKEGCNSGDCGACTAVLAQRGGDGRLRYTPINTCIALMSSLHNSLLITVDGLADGGEDGKLHPVQAAMVEEHGSQCGFCTPGFVMSLFAMSKHRPPAAEGSVADAIAGNLCRCTGYRPIVSAGMKLLAAPPAADYYDQQQAQIAARLAALAQQDAPPPESNADIAIARSAAELKALYQKHPQARLFAGATDLALEINLQKKQLPLKIDISRVSDYRDCRDDGGQWTLGATATIAECMDFFAARLPAMLPYLKRYGSQPIRARATVGGNIGNASPIADMPPPLLALAADIALTNGSNARQLPLADFYLDYKKTALAAGEWISAVTFPAPPAGSVFKVFKISKRIEDDISIVAAAFYWRIGSGNVVEEARLAFGGMAAIPKRAHHAEQAFIGHAWSEQTAAAAAQALAQDFTPLSDMRGSDRYRLQAAGGLIKRAYLETQGELPRIEELAHAAG